MNLDKMPMTSRFLFVLALVGVAWAPAVPAQEEDGAEGGAAESGSVDEPGEKPADEPADKPETAVFDEPADGIETEAAGPAAPADDDLELHSPLRFYSASPGAETGLVRVHEAFGGPAMSMRLSLHGGFYNSDSFLNYLNEEDYSQSHVTGRVGLSFTPIEYLEAFVNLRSTSNKNTSSTPGLLQTQGDLEIGAKGMYRVLPCLGLGLDAAVSFTNGIGDVSPAFDGTNFRSSLLVSFDARPLMREATIRAHLNAGIIVENTDALQKNRQLTWTEQYALGVNKYHRVALGFGLDAPLAYLDPVGISPFVEFTMEIPLNVSDEELGASSLGEGTTVVDIMPMRLTPGVRVTYLTDITLDVAVDIGLGGEKAYVDGVPATPPWTMWFGLTYAFDPTRTAAPAAPEPILLAGFVTNREDGSALGGAAITFAGTTTTPVASDPESGHYMSRHDLEGTVTATCSRDGFKPETHEILIARGEPVTLDFSLEPEPKKEEPPPVTTGKVVGRVINTADQMPIPFAIISFDGVGLTPVATDELEGKYATYQIPPGTVELTAAKDGYKPLSQGVEVKLGETSILDFALEADVKLVTLSGSVTDQKDKPLVARVQIDGPKPVELISAKDTGAFAVEVPVGSCAVKVTADGYMAKARRFELKENQAVMAEFKLSPRPKKVVVVLKKDRIAVTKKIHFASGKTALRADAHQILDGVIDILVNHPEVKRVRIEGHTDSAGSAKLNQRLSQGRAEAVMNYLLGQGIPSDRIEAKGYGEDKPIAPNTSRRGREQNRRVEFTILGQ